MYILTYLLLDDKEGIADIDTYLPTIPVIIF